MAANAPLLHQPQSGQQQPLYMRYAHAYALKRANARYQRQKKEHQTNRAITHDGQRMLRLDDVIPPPLDGYTKSAFLEHSLFGSLTTQVDKHTGHTVVIKHSLRSELVGGTATSPHNTRKETVENVEREFRVLSYLHTPPTALRELAQETFLWNGLSERAATQMCVDARMCDDITKGRAHLLRVYRTWTDARFVHTVYEHLPGGDVCNILIANPHRAFEPHAARRGFRQICLAVRYMHAHCVAHLDISIENVCIDTKGAFRLIDFGSATQHPCVPHALERGLCSPHVRLLDASPLLVSLTDTALSSFSSPSLSTTMEEEEKQEDEAAADEAKANEKKDATSSSTKNDAKRSIATPLRPCRCVACVYSEKVVSAKRANGGGSIIIANNNHLPALSCMQKRNAHTFMCRPICHHVNAPGKGRSMAPEVYLREKFDAYAADCFSLGCLLFQLLVGETPFELPLFTEPMFASLMNGEYDALPRTLHPLACDLILSLITPAERRLSIDEIIAHPFMHLPLHM